MVLLKSRIESTNKHCLTTPKPRSISCTMAPTEYPAGSEEATILAVIQSLLSAVPKKDLKTLLAPTFPSGGAQTIHNGLFETQTIQSLCEKIISMPGDLAETFHDIEIRIDGTGQLAMVWANSKVMLDGNVIIEGTNAMSLHKVGGRWGISSISDVSRPVEGRKGDVEKIYEGAK